LARRGPLRGYQEPRSRAAKSLGDGVARDGMSKMLGYQAENATIQEKVSPDRRCDLACGKVRTVKSQLPE